MSIPVIVMGGAGRMGSTITRLVREDSAFALVGRVEQASRLGELTPLDGCRDAADVASVLTETGHPVIIDFTSPSFSLATARTAAKHGAAHVIGTTGLTQAEKDELTELARNTRLFWAPNMSVGVTALLKILPELARLLGDAYDMEMVEIHHNRKKDSPSGTALRLAETMAAARGWNLKDTARCCREGIIGERPHKEMGLQAVRGGDVVGVHTAYFLGTGERIEVTHQAQSRDNFAQGALRAAKWLVEQQPGALYSMEDVLSL